jgi:hypothetical protein
MLQSHRQISDNVAFENAEAQSRYGEAAAWRSRSAVCPARWRSREFMELTAIRADIEHMRRQILRQRREIRDLQRAGIPTASAEELLGRIQSKVDELCSERDRQLGEQRRKYSVTGNVIHGSIERRFR